jgi:hypothetical protein
VYSWGGTMGLELGDTVVNCSTKLQSRGRRKRVWFMEEINQCVRILEEVHVPAEWYDVYAICRNPREACLV